MWRAIDGDSLSPVEQSALVQQMRAILSDKPASTTRYDARSVAQLAESVTDE